MSKHYTTRVASLHWWFWKEKKQKLRTLFLKNDIIVMVCQKFLIQCFKLFFSIKIVCKHTKRGIWGFGRALQIVGLFLKSFSNKLSEINSSFIFHEYRFNICLPRHFLSLKRESNNYVHASLIRTFLVTFTLSCQFIEVKNIVTLKFFL